MKAKEFRILCEKAGFYRGIDDPHQPSMINATDLGKFLDVSRSTLWRFRTKDGQATKRAIGMLKRKIKKKALAGNNKGMV